MSDHDDEHIDRIGSAAMRALPKDTIRTFGPVELMLGAAPEGGISVGLLIEGQGPLGPIEVYLTGSQVEKLAAELHSLVGLNADETAALVARVHRGDQ